MKKKFSYEAFVKCTMLCLLSGIVSVILAYFFNGFYQRAFDVPICREGDTNGTYSLFSNIIRGQWMYEFPNIGAPFGVDLSSEMQFYTLHVFLVKLCCMLAGGKVGVAINSFYLLTFFLIAFFCCLSLKLLHTNDILSIVFSVLYSILPYHFLRNITHIWLSAYYLVPLCVTIIIIFLSDEFCTKLTTKQKFGWFCFFAMGMSDLYYTAFTMLILAVAYVVRILTKKMNIRVWLYGLSLYFSILCGLLIQMIPIILSYINNPKTQTMFTQNRSAADIEAFSLRMSMLFLPIHGHRIPILSTIRELFETTYPNTTLNSMTSLGIIFSIGVILALYQFFFLKSKFIPNEKRNYVHASSLLLIFVLFIASYGGLSDYIVLIIPYIRAYNRFVVFIAFFSAFIFASYIEYYVNTIRCSLNKKRYIEIILAISILAIGCFDQTSADYANKSDYDIFNQCYNYSYEQINDIGYQEQEIAEYADASLEKYKSVFQLPIKSDTLWNLWPTGKIGGNELMLVSSYATNTKWSYGGQYHDTSDLWLNTLTKIEFPELMNHLVIEGFGGIYIDARGYDEQQLQEILQFIQNETGSTYINRGNMYFFDIEDYIDSNKNKELILYKLDPSNLFCTNQKCENRIYVHPGGIQYGPYYWVNKGRYLVKYSGENLSNLDFTCTYNKGTEHIPIEIVRCTSNEVIYEVELYDFCEIEFCGTNRGEDNVIIDSIIVSSNGME